MHRQEQKVLFRHSNSLGVLYLLKTQVQTGVLKILQTQAHAGASDIKADGPAQLTVLCLKYTQVQLTKKPAIQEKAPYKQLQNKQFF